MRVKCDLVVIGGGIVGLATARAWLLRHPRSTLVLLESHHALASAQTGHNSGVIHSGVYYTPGSLKARLCVAGRKALLDYCERHTLPYRLCGKLIVALDESELAPLQRLYERAQANGVEQVSLLEPTAFRDIEPYVNGVRALWVPGTGVVDFVAVAHALASDVRAAGGEIVTGARVERWQRDGAHSVVETRDTTYHARFVIACAGLYADRVARMAGAPDAMRIVPFRGDYYVLKPHQAYLCRTLIYPVPDPRFPWLGVHFTRRLDGQVWAGPNAVLAGAREGYGRLDLHVGDLRETLGYPGFWNLARRYWRTGLAEMWRDYCKSAYTETMRRYLPQLQSRDVMLGPSGVRAQALDADGNLIDDFDFYVAPGLVCVRNAPSPAATSCLGIADAIVERAEETFFEQGASR
jgi:L-2-hydroxyglutarate oxidase LhgO